MYRLIIAFGLAALALLRPTAAVALAEAAELEHARANARAGGSSFTGNIDARLDALALCQQAERAWATAGNLRDGTPAHDKAHAEGRRLDLEINRLRVRVFTKPDKTWDDVAVLAIIALHTIAARLIG
jgi:hypothetical protein